MKKIIRGRFGCFFLVEFQGIHSRPRRVKLSLCMQVFLPHQLSTLIVRNVQCNLLHVSQSVSITMRERTFLLSNVSKIDIERNKQNKKGRQEGLGRERERERKTHIYMSGFFFCTCRTCYCYFFFFKHVAKYR